MATKHRAVIIGTGAVVNSHLSALEAELDRVELLAAMDIDEARVKAVCEKAGIPRWYTNASEMLAAEQPDIVHLTAPPATHLSLITECLEAGAWVFTEKPVCLSLAEFDTLSEVEQRTGRYFSNVFQWRFGSAAKHIRHLIETGGLGRPMVLVCNTLWYRTQAYYDVAWRGRWDNESGGPTMTLGIHMTDMLLWMMGGTWQEVRAMAATLNHDIEVEDISLALVRFEGGTLATITNSALSPRQESYLRMDFEKATLECSTLYRYTNENWRFSLPESGGDPSAQAAWEALYDQEDIMGGHNQQYKEFLDSYEANERPLVSGSEARRILEFSASLYKAAATGLPVRKGDITPEDPYYQSMGGPAGVK